MEDFFIIREQLIQMRGDIIQRFSGAEMALCTYICEHYFSKKNWDFTHTVLYNEYMTFGLRLNVFEKLVKKNDVLEKKELNKLMDKLRKLNKIRNIFAHAWLYSPEKDSELATLISPEGMGKPHKVRELEANFDELQKEALDILLRLIPKEED